MATYTTTTDDNQEAGLTAAREAYNASVPDENKIADNAAYVAFVLSAAFDSYQKQYKVGAGA